MQDSPELRVRKARSLAVEKGLRIANLLATGLDFLPVLKGGDSLDHAVAWLETGSH